MARASYKRAIEWIAGEDGDAWQAAVADDLVELSQLMTVVFVANLWNKSEMVVARAVQRAVMAERKQLNG